MPKAKAIALYSGGLDSLLAMKIITMQNIEVIALHIDTGFEGKDQEAKEDYLKRAIVQTGAKLKILDIKEQFIKEILFNPKYGYGKNFNPCIDCHGNMFKIAYELAKQENADFLISGEVIGQRPMSQRGEALKQVVKLSGADDIILRPLSAKLLPPTKPELDGLVDRDKLFDISGRGRQKQLLLAKEWGIVEYESPSGGCLLTDANYSNKIKDFVKHDSFDIKDIDILKFGRHLRLDNGTKLIIARNHEENLKLIDIKNEKFLKIDIGELKGPVVLIDKNFHKNDLKTAISLAITYSKTTPNTFYKIKFLDKIYEAKLELSKDDAKRYFI